MVSGINNGVKLPPRVIQTEDGKTYKKPGLGATAGGILLGDMAAGFTLMGIQKPLGKYLMKSITKVPPEQNEVYKNIIDKAFAKSNLAEKGVEFVDATLDNTESVKNAIDKCLPKWLSKSKKLEFLKDMLVDRTSETLIDGRNAAFAPKANAILVNKDKMSMAAFHEMGHAMNKNFAGVGKVLSKIRGPLAVFAPLAVFIGFCKRKKAEGEQPKNIVDRATTFIKNNCGVIAFSAMLPTVIEEGMASFKASKLVKSLEGTTPEMLKNLNKYHGKALLSYAAMAIGMGIAGIAGRSVRDAIAAPKEIQLKTAE